MRQRSSAYSNCMISALAMAYVTAHREHGIRVWVPRQSMTKFVDTERVLVASGLDVLGFAKYVVNTHLQWCRNRGMQRVPVSILLGPNALRRYIQQVRMTGRVNVTSTPDSHLVVQCEAQVAEAYITCKLVDDSTTFAGVVEQLSHGLSPRWVQANDEDAIDDGVVAEVIKMLRIQFHLNGAVLRTYDDVVRAVKEKNHEL